jgi:predicted lipoprotein with Yx(FWY)xxD motif
MKRLTMLAVAAAALVPASPAMSTPGRTDANGCHTDRKGGTGYHCHNQGSSSARPRPQSGTSRQPFANCSAARAAGAAPVMRGDPGYGQHLDRDNDGIGCE